MRVKDIMSSPPITVTEETLLPEVARIMQERNIGAVIVVDQSGRMAGLITETDFATVASSIPFSLRRAAVIFGAKAPSAQELEAIYAEARKLAAADVMSRDVVTATENEPVGNVIRRMLDRDLKHVPVVRDGVPVGMLARHDVVKLAMDRLVNPASAR